MIVIKLKEVPNSKEGLMERTRRAWRIDINRLYGEDKLIALYKGKVLQAYNVLSYTQDTELTNRVAFTLEETESDLQGQKISYRTANPCTIVSESDLVLEN